MKRWDVFISYASEDKAQVVLPLSRHLSYLGLKVWLDSHELGVGDSLREKIEEGLAQSRFGVVIISPRFLEKDWPKREVNAMMALEQNGRKVILPVWHGIDRKTLSRVAPILADRFAANTNEDLSHVARAIAKVVLGKSVSRRGTLSAALSGIIETNFDPSLVRALLLREPDALAKIMNCSFFSEVEFCGPELVGEIVPDIWMSENQPYCAIHRLVLFLFGPPDSAVFERDELASDLDAMVSGVAATQESLLRRRGKSRRHPVIDLDGWLPLESFCRDLGHVEAVIFAGRRGHLSPGAAQLLGDHSRANASHKILTYDRLLDATLPSDQDNSRGKRV